MSESADYRRCSLQGIPNNFVTDSTASFSTTSSDQEKVAVLGIKVGGVGRVIQRDLCGRERRRHC